MQQTTDSILKLIKEEKINFIDFRFTDLKGLWHHITFHAQAIDKQLLEEGIAFDGSSIAGWKAIEDSDMVMQPDLSTAIKDPFCSQSTLSIICDIHDPISGDVYDLDPRGVAKRAELYLQNEKFADKAYFGPEAEFFIFDDVRYGSDIHQSYYFLDTREGEHNTGKLEDHGNLAHRPGVKGGYVPLSPIDSLSDMRSEMLSTLVEMGLSVEKHHHEVATGQHELGFKYNTLTTTADAIQIYKYVVKNIALTYGKTATFMPKPLYGVNGSGMHVHQSLWKGNEPLFAGEKYEGLSQEALYYIGGLIKHGHALNAFNNPTTNSYKRLSPGYEAPVILAYAARNRSASIRIPYASSRAAKRIEARFPDPTANSYLAFASLLLAGLDGIRNKIHPGETVESNLYELQHRKQFIHVASSLEKALEALDQDREFLKVGSVFNDSLIDTFIKMKREEIEAVNLRPHPLEFKMYYSL